MSDIKEIIKKEYKFDFAYNKAHRLAAAVFTVSNILEQQDELRTNIKKLALNIVSMSINLKDASFEDAKKLLSLIEKNSLELTSMLDIAAISGLISKMNADILKEEFQSFILEISKFSEHLEIDKSISIRSFFDPKLLSNSNTLLSQNYQKIEENKIEKIGKKNNNSQKRKDLRKSTILDFIKGHNNVNIKDIVPNVRGCSEKTIQRELAELLSEDKIRKVGERRWTRYSAM